ncbi:MAG TPA: hypothetical protein VMT67_16565 [Terriglobales bacterium]|nr:hypothetical protein [Terriglobales bacterium]
MIFGFNTDIRHDDTVYHVQSEAREGDQLLQTQVFVRGRCIGKRAVSYSAAAASQAASPSAGGDGAPEQNPELTKEHSNNKDQDKERLLRDLHREVLDAIREGRLDSILDKRDAPETLAAIKELDLQWTNADSVHSGGSLMMNLRVTEAGQPIQGARLTFRFARPNAAPYYAQVLSDAQGHAEMSVHVDEQELPDSSVLVQASFQGRTATRKFQVRRA